MTTSLGIPAKFRALGVFRMAPHDIAVATGIVTMRPPCRKQVPSMATSRLKRFLIHDSTEGNACPARILKKVLINPRVRLPASVHLSQLRAKTERPAAMERRDGLRARVHAPATLPLEPPPTIHYHCCRITEWARSPRRSAPMIPC